MNRFGWLLRREWMQHHRGWLILALLPLLLALLVLPFGHIDLDGRSISTQMLGVVAATGYVYGVMVLVAGAVLFQAAGMARRDQQDRSIEFWLSLPTGHSQSLLATLLMHVLLMPLMVLAISFVGAQLVAAVLVVRVDGMAALGATFDAGWFGYHALAFGRLVLGLVVAMLWMSAVLLGAMASAAWLKGWGVPALVAAAGILGLLVKQFTGSPIVTQTIGLWFRQASVALLPLTRGEGPVKAALKGEGLDGLRDWMATETPRLLADLATPQLATALMIGALGFGLLVWRRAGGWQWQMRRPLGR